MSCQQKHSSNRGRSSENRGAQVGAQHVVHAHCTISERSHGDFFIATGSAQGKSVRFQFTLGTTSTDFKRRPPDS